MPSLDHCPSCRSLPDAWRALSLPVDIGPEAAAHYDAPLLHDADYQLCRRCELVFARQRQALGEAEAYYAPFTQIEDRSYATWPPPQAFLDAQRDFSTYLLGVLADAGLLQRGQSVLNLRSECGAHLVRLRDEHGAGELWGLDHFASNLRWCREELGLANVYPLHPARFSVPSGPERFDLVLANHLLTHALDPLDALTQLRRFLAPGGALVLYNEIDHVPVLRKAKRHVRGFNNFHKQLLTSNALANLCALAGFEARELSREAKGRRWAASGHSMVWLARPAAEADTQNTRALRADPDRVLAAIRSGRRAAHAKRLWVAARGLARAPFARAG